MVISTRINSAATPAGESGGGVGAGTNSTGVPLGSAMLAGVAAADGLGVLALN
jgi:hypothetical protein